MHYWVGTIPLNFTNKNLIHRSQHTSVTSRTVTEHLRHEALVDSNHQFVFCGFGTDSTGFFFKTIELTFLITFVKMIETS